jgi:ribosome maturation factor RimP
VNKTEKTVLELAEPVAAALGLSIWDVEYGKEGRGFFLRIYIDREESGKSVSIDDCEAFSRAVEKALDEKDPIENAYCLEVSSPGIDRVLKRPSDFLKYTGRKIDIWLYAPLDGRKELRGALLGYENGVITLQNGDGEIKIEKSKASAVRLAFEF